MKKLIFLALISAVTLTANAQRHEYYNYNYNSRYAGNNGYNEPSRNRRSDTDFAIITSYGVTDNSSISGGTINLTFGYDISKKMRLSAVGDFQLIGNSENFWSIAAMFGTTELYTSRHSNTFTEVSFGIGYERFLYEEWSIYGENISVKDGVFFPVRLRWGYSLTKNIDFGLDLMGALTTIEYSPWLFRAGLFLGVRF